MKQHRGIRHWHVYYRRNGGEWELHSRHRTQAAANDAVAFSSLPDREWRVEHWDGQSIALAEDTRQAAEWREDSRCQRPPL